MIMTDEFKPIIRDPHKSANMLEQPVAPVPVPQPPSDPIEQVLSPREVSEGLAKADPLTRHPRVSSIMLSVVFGLLLERLLFRHFYQRDHLDQVLLTFGLIYIFEEMRSLLWGDDVHGVAIPPLLKGSIALTDEEAKALLAAFRFPFKN